MLARRLVSRAPGELELEVHEVPDAPPPGGILARADATAVSAGTEIANYEGRTTQRVRAGTDPYYPGYSFAGTILAADVDGFRAGDRICGPLPHASHVVEARPERLARITPVPESVEPWHAALTQIGCIVLNAVRMAGVQLGDRVAVVGAGLIGLLAGRLAAMSGGRAVTALDLHAPRLEVARAFGAHAALDPADPATADELARLAPTGFDVVFEATGAPAGVTSAVKLAGRGGRVVLLGSTRGLVDGFDPYADVHVKGVTIHGAHVSTTPAVPTLRDRWTEAANRRALLELMESGALDVGVLVTDRIPPARAPAAFSALAAEPAAHLGVIIDWS